MVLVHFKRSKIWNTWRCRYLSKSKGFPCNTSYRFLWCSSWWCRSRYVYSKFCRFFGDQPVLRWLDWIEDTERETFGCIQDKGERQCLDWRKIMRLCPSDLMRKSPPDSRRTRTNWGRPIHCVLRESSRNISTIICRTVTPITAQNWNITSSLEKLRGKSITSSLEKANGQV